jgi:pyruvate/2-oxoglutarate dehydrogenase complex dihydrolipoamide dehydrogenase (E3) component/anti-anti-sigma regulatory factor
MALPEYRVRSEVLMSRNYEYDLVVIGAGIAGMVAAVTANGLGKSVAVVEKRRIGGNCTSFTCIPSKALVRAGHICDLVTHMDRFGLKFNSAAELDTTGVLPRVRSVVQRAYEKDVAETFERIGIHVISGTAKFLDNHRIRVDSRTISSGKFIIAAGTRPLVPPIDGLQEIPYLTNETVFGLEELPQSMIILGGGADGLEYASAFGRMGVNVSVVHRPPRLLPDLDRELVNRLLAHLQAAGIRILSGTQAERFSAAPKGIRLAVKKAEGAVDELETDAVLLTIGRKSDVEGLELEKAHVEYTARGIVTDRTLRTTAPNIYACGDVAGPYQLASTAEYQGIIAATNAVLPVKKKVDYSNAVFVLFTEPTLAYVGLTEQQARQKHGNAVRVYRFDYHGMRRAMVDGAEDGVAKFVCSRGGKLLGAHILGEGAADVIHEAQVIKALKQPLRKVYAITHAYPTYAQALVGRAGQLAFLDWMASRFLVRQVLKLLPGFQNRLSVARDRLAETDEPVEFEDTVEIEMKYHKPSGEKVSVHLDRLGRRACLVKLPSALNASDETPLTGCRSDIDDSILDLILDFSAVERMNGLGAAMLAKVCALAGRRRGRLFAIGVHEHYRNVFNLTGLGKAIRVYENTHEAFAAIGMHSADLPRNTWPIAVPQDVDHWAKPVERLVVPSMPAKAVNLNVAGRRIVGAVAGFGRLWQKRYQLRVRGLNAAPESLMKELRENFVSLQPPFNRFYVGADGLRPGAVVLFDASTPGGLISSGVLVMYADERSFTFITPQGHPESGWITFSAFEGRDGTPIVEILGLARANDPVYESAYRTLGSRIQVKIWTHILAAFAMQLGVPAEITVEKVCVDPKVQWSQAGNVWYNAQVRTFLHIPRRWVGRLMTREGWQIRRNTTPS